MRVSPLENVFVRADPAEEDSSNKQSRVYVARPTLADGSWIMFPSCKTRRGIPRSAYKVSWDAALSVFLLFCFKKTFKQMKEKWRHTRSRTQSLSLVLTLQAQTQEQSWTFFPSHPYVHSFVLHPVHRSVSWPFHLLGTCEFALLNSLSPCVVRIVVSAHLLSSIRRPPLYLWVSLHWQNKKKKDPRRRLMSPEFIDGCTVLRDVGEIERLVPAEWRHSKC